MAILVITTLAVTLFIPIHSEIAEIVGLMGIMEAMIQLDLEQVLSRRWKLRGWKGVEQFDDQRQKVPGVVKNCKK